MTSINYTSSSWLLVSLAILPRRLPSAFVTQKYTIFPQLDVMNIFCGLVVFSQGGFRCLVNTSTMAQVLIKTAFVTGILNFEWIHWEAILPRRNRRVWRVKQSDHRLSVSSHPLYRSEKIRPRMTWVMRSPILLGYRLLRRCSEISALSISSLSLSLSFLQEPGTFLCDARRESNKLVYYQQVSQLFPSISFHCASPFVTTKAIPFRGRPYK